MKKKVLLCIMLSCLLFIPQKVSAFLSLVSVEEISYQQLLEHWSPRVYQDVHPDYDVRADFITRINLDGDWLSTNQWETVDTEPLEAYVYTSVSETESHYFVGYYFYHPRDDGPDWGAFGDEAHENDLEGIMLGIKKNGNFGEFVAMNTIRHSDFYQYANGSISEGYETIDNSVSFYDGSHPEIFISSNGQYVLNTNPHGHDIQAYTGDVDVGNDAIIYEYTGQADIPSEVSPPWEHVYGYDMLPLDELWDLKTTYQNTPFQSFGAFGSSVGDGNANAPWNWSDTDHQDNGTVGYGVFVSDPAYMFDVHFNKLGSDFSHQYISNSYWTHKITLNWVQPIKAEDYSNENDLYVDIWVDGKKYIGERMWKKNNAKADGTKYYPTWGSNDNAVSTIDFSSKSNTIYIAREPGSKVKLEVFDSDGTSADDSLGYIEITPNAGEAFELTNLKTSNGGAYLDAIVETR
ncbi:hypothetical protein [Chengkuizengella axinellae]|uniref:DUF3472 domain-containing protein n=1 Tax=Chengkuizengella axinellae TaxID=3064388 RepID=A0ABT9J0G9_9BACL|nr:hypothetical protein [Chengkuizengella sp. 2205SS18-9]MDP5275082.1 hypothetical protein [Chengkuizengella sp. 2205SS18-9]